MKIERDTYRLLEKKKTICKARPLKEPTQCKWQNGPFLPLCTRIIVQILNALCHINVIPQSIAGIATMFAAIGERELRRNINTDPDNRLLTCLPGATDSAVTHPQWVPSLIYRIVSSNVWQAHPSVPSRLYAYGERSNWRWFLFCLRNCTLEMCVGVVQDDEGLS